MVASRQQPAPTQPLTPQSAPVSEALYVQNDLDSQIFGFRIDEKDGSLTPISGSPFPIPANVRNLSATVDGKFLLAARFGGFPGEPVGTYAIPIRSDGSLPPVPDAPSLPGVIMMLSVRPDQVFSVEAPAQITQRPFDPASGSFSAPTVVTPCFPHVFEQQCGWIWGPSPDGNTLWTSGEMCDRVQCSVLLTAIPLQDGNVAFQPDDRFALAGIFTNPVVLNSGVVSVAFNGFDSDSVVTLYSSDGQLVSKCGSVDSPGCNQAFSVASDPLRSFLFIGTLDGKLSSVPLTAGGFSAQQVTVWLSAGIRPDNMMVNSTGKFLYILDSLSNSVTGYSIAPDGRLSPILGAKFDVSGPNAASNGLLNRAMAIVELPAK